MSFSMEVTNEEALKKEVIEQIKPVSEDVAKLQALAENNVSEIMAIDLESLEKRKVILNSIESFGMDTIRNSSKRNTLLHVTVKDFSKMGEDGGVVGKGLVELQREIKNLDPSLIDFTKTGFLGRIFNPIRDYFAKYQKADAVISDIVGSLEKGKITLKNDNVTFKSLYADL